MARLVKKMMSEACRKLILSISIDGLKIIQSLGVNASRKSTWNGNQALIDAYFDAAMMRT